MMSESGRWIRDFWLQFAGGLSHFGVGPSVEASADESPGVHHLGEVHPLKEKNSSFTPVSASPFNFDCSE